MESEAQYWDKFKDMQKYIPFLESMINRLELKKNATDMPREAQLSKIKSLRALLLDTSKRMKLENLEKCEQVLVKLYSKVEKTDILPTSIKLNVTDNDLLSDQIQQGEAVVSDSVGSSLDVDLNTADSVLDVKILLPISDDNTSMPVTNQPLIVSTVTQSSPVLITTPVSAAFTSDFCSETVSPSIDTNVSSIQEPTTPKLAEPTVLTESYTTILEQCRVKLMSVSKKSSIMSISVPAPANIVECEVEAATNNESLATVEQTTSFKPSFYTEKIYDDLSPDENTNASLSDADESNYLFQRRTPKQTSNDLSPNRTPKKPRNYTRVLRSPESSPWRRTESTLFQRRSPKRSPRRRRSRSLSPAMKDDRKSNREFYRQGSNSSSRSKTKEKSKADMLGNIDIKLRENKKKLNKLNSAILNTIMKCDEKDVDIDQLRKVRQQIVEELKRTSANEDISEYILKSYKKIKKKKKKNNDKEEGEICSDDEVVEKIYGNLVIEMKKERELLDSKSEKNSSVVVPENDVCSEKKKKDMPKIKISLIISDNVGDSEQDNKETPRQSGLISSANKIFSLGDNILIKNDTEEHDVKLQASHILDKLMIKTASRVDTSCNIDPLHATSTGDGNTSGSNEANKDLRRQTDALKPEQPRLVSESSKEKTVDTTGIISEIDILQALDNEIKGENISLTGLAAINSSSVAKPKKNIISETLLNQDGDKKRRISLEKYKEKVGPSLTLSQPNVFSPSQSNQIQQQSLLSPSSASYEDHVKLISRALTAKEYERFHSIISTTINDNIADPETNLSLRPKPKKDPTSFLQDLEVEMGPKSPEVEYTFPEDFAVPVIIPSDPVTESSMKELPLASKAVPSCPSVGHDIDMRIAFQSQVNRVPQPTPFSPPHIGLTSPSINAMNTPLAIPPAPIIQTNLSFGNLTPRHSMSDVGEHAPMQVYPNIKPDNVAPHLPSEKFTKSVVPKPIAITNKFNVSFPVSANYKGKNPKPILGYSNVLSPSTSVAAVEPKPVWDQDVMRLRAASRATSVSRSIEQDVRQAGDMYQGPDIMSYRSYDQSATAYNNVDTRNPLYTSFETDDFGPKVQADHINDRLARARSREPSAIPSLMDFNNRNMDYDNRHNFDYNRATNSGRSLFRDINDDPPSFREHSVGRNMGNCNSSFCNFDKDCLSQFPNDRKFQDHNEKFMREKSLGYFDMDCNYGRLATQDDYECDFRLGHSMEQYDYDTSPRTAFVRGRSVGRTLDSRSRDRSIGSFDPRRRDKSVGRSRDKSVGRNFDRRTRDKSVGRKFDSRNVSVSSSRRDKSIGRSCDPKDRDKAIERSSVGRQDSSVNTKISDPRLRETNFDSKTDEPYMGKIIDSKEESREFSNSRDPRRSRLDKFESKSEQDNLTSMELNKNCTEKDSDRAKTAKSSSSNQSPIRSSPRKLSERHSNRDRAKEYFRDNNSVHEKRRAWHFSRDSKKKATGLIYTNDNLARGLLGQSCGVRNYKIPKIKRNSIDEDTKAVTDKNVVDIADKESLEKLVTSSIEDEQNENVKKEINKDNSEKIINNIESSVNKSNLTHNEKLDTSDKIIDKTSNVLDSKDDASVKDSTPNDSHVVTKSTVEQSIKQDEKARQDETSDIKNDDMKKDSFPTTISSATENDEDIDADIALEVYKLESRLSSSDTGGQYSSVGSSNEDNISRTSVEFDVSSLPTSHVEKQQMIDEEKKKVLEKPIQNIDTIQKARSALPCDNISAPLEVPDSTLHVDNVVDKEQHVKSDQLDVVDLPDSTNESEQGGEVITKSESVEGTKMIDNQNESGRTSVVEDKNESGRSSVAGPSTENLEIESKIEKKPIEKLSSSDHQAIDTLGSILSLLKDKTKIMQILSLLDDNNETEKIKKKLSKLAEIESDDEDSTKETDNKNTVKSEVFVESEDPLPAKKRSIMKKKKTIKKVTKYAAKKTMTKIKKKVTKKKKPVVKRITRSKAKAVIPFTVPTETTGTGKKRRDELQKLQEDIRDMFISKGVLGLTGIRNCRIQKMANAEELPAPDSPQANKTKRQKNIPNKRIKAQLKAALPETRGSVPCVVIEKANIHPPEETNEGELQKPVLKVKVLLTESKKGNKIDDEGNSLSTSTETPLVIKKKKKPGPKPRGFVKPIVEEVINDKKTISKVNEEDEKSTETQTRGENTETVATTRKIIADKPLVSDTIISTKIKPGPKSKKISTLKSLIDRNVEDRRGELKTMMDDLIGMSTTAENVEETTESVKDSSFDSEDESLSSFISNSSTDNAHIKTLTKNKRKKAWSLGIIKSKKKKLVKVSEEDKKVVETEVVAKLSDNKIDHKFFTDEQYCFSGESINYLCKICSYEGPDIVHHYKINHFDIEVPISRLSPTNAVDAVKQSLSTDFDSYKLYSQERNLKHECRFCQKTLTSTLDLFFSHIVKEHTGEYKSDAQKSTHVPSVICEAAPPSEEQSLLLGYICGRCNYTQLSLENLKAHVANRHNDEETEVYTINMSAIAPEQDNEMRFTRRTLRLRKQQPVGDPVTSEPTVKPTNETRISPRKLADEPSQVHSDEEVLDTVRLSKNVSYPTSDLVVRNIKRERTEEWQENDAAPDEQIQPKRIATSCAFAMVSEHTEGSPEVCPADLILPECIKKEKNTDGRAHSSTENCNLEPSPEPVDTGFILEKSVDGLNRYKCAMRQCPFKTIGSALFRRHINMAHNKQTWSGYCSLCKSYTSGTETRQLMLVDALNHFVKEHDSEDVPQTLSAVCSTNNAEVSPIAEPVSHISTNATTEATPSPPGPKQRLYITVKPLAHLVSQPVAEQIPNLCNLLDTPQPDESAEPSFLQLRIENVVSLNTTESKKSPVPEKAKGVQSIQSSPTDKRESGNVLIHYSPNINSANIKPGTVVISKASSASKAMNEDRSSKLATLPWCSPTADSATKDAATSEPSTSILHKKEKDSISKIISVIAQSKQPLVLQRMLISAKILHLYKCGNIYCSYTTSSAYDFTRHLAEHRMKRAVSTVCLTGETRCVYCSYENFSVIDLERHVLEEHGHCTHACSYCWYIATAGSLVELHRMKTHQQSRPKVLKLKPVANHSHRESLKMMRPRNEVILPYLCKQTNSCKYKCYTSAVFISHLKVHVGNAPYKCAYCLGTFVRIVYLMRHLREHGLCLYQCPYCLHGADTEIEMLNHVAEYHPNRSTVAHLRYVVEKKVSDAELSKCKTLPLVNLDKTEVQVFDCIEQCPEEDPIQEVENSNRLRAVLQQESGAESTDQAADPKASQIEDTAKDIPAESTETIQSSEMAILSVTSEVEETTKKSESSAVLIKVEDGQKNVEKVKETFVPVESDKSLQDEVICIDSDDDDFVKSNLLTEEAKKSTDSAPETKEKRMTRLSSEKGKDKTKQNDEVITVMDDDDNVPATTTVTASQNPLQCARCSVSIKRVHNFKQHINKCYVKHKSSIRCKLCQAGATDADDLVAHIMKVHRGEKPVFCDLCSYQGWEFKLVIAHMWQVHKVQASDLDRVETGTDGKDMKIVVKLKEESRRSGPKKKISVGKAPAEIKKVSFGPEDINELPLNPILDEIIFCSKCRFGTKVRSNMLRHLQLHASEIAVPSVAPVNPVPHLESNEKHFDKMANLALSSNIGRMGGDKSNSKEKQETRKVIDPSSYPKYMPDNERYVCGALGCQYISLNEMTLKHHWEALHPGVTSYKCVHCPSNQQLDTSRPLTGARIVAHLKMHDVKLYVCSECKYYHHQKHLVERHLADKHGNVPKASVCIVRDAEVDVVPEKQPLVEKSPQKGQPTMDLKPWKCNICKYKTLLRSDIIMHCHQKHGLKLQFKCGFCSFLNSNSHNVTRHIQIYHEGKSDKTVIKVYDKDDGSGNDDASDAPNWWNQNKRSCVFTDDGNSDSGSQSGLQRKLMKVDQNNSSDEMDKESNVVNRVLGITQALSQDNIEENAVDLNIVKTEEDMEGFNHPKSFGEYGEPKGTSFLCSLCTSHVTSDVEEMKNHLYEELNYRKLCCPVCAYKAFDMPRFQQHSMIEHTQYHTPKELPADAAIEKWVDSVIAHQSAIIEKFKETNSKEPAEILAPRCLTRTNLLEITDEPSNTSIEEEYILSDSTPNFLLSETPKMDSPQGSIANDDPNQRLSIADLEKQYGPFGAPQGQTFACPKCEYRTHVAKDMEEHLLAKFEAPFWSCSICHATHKTYQEAQSHNSKQHRNTGSNQRKAPVKQHVQQWISSMLQVQKLTMNYMPSLVPDKTSATAETSTVDELLVVRREGKPKVIKTPVKNAAARKRKLSEDSDDSADRLVIFEPSKQDVMSTKLPTTPTKEKPSYQCPHCEFSTKYKTSLVNHIPQHFNMKPFRCPYCDFHNYKKYVRSHVAKDHPGMPITAIQNVMPDVLPGTVSHKRGRLDVINPKKELICLVCNTAMSSLQSPLHHESSHPGQEMQLVRRGDIVFLCKECFKYQKTSKLMTEHFETVHPTLKINYSMQKYKQVKNVVHVCLLCNINFAYMWDLKCHHEHAHRSMKLTYVTKNISSLSDEKTAAVKEGNAASEDEVVEVVSDTEGEDAQPEMLRSSMQAEFNINKKMTARKSTTKLPMSLKMVARKSTTKLPYDYMTEHTHVEASSEEEPVEFSHYGDKPDMNVGHIKTRMPFYGTMMEVTVKKLSELIKIYPVIICKDINEKIDA